MHGITATLNHLTDTTAIMTKAKNILGSIDPGFSQIEKAYRENVAQLQKETQGRAGDWVQDYISARDRAFAQEVLYIAWQGLALNMEIFQNPVSGLLLKGSYETLNREYLLESLPGVRLARQQAKAARQQAEDLPESAQQLLGEIAGYYDYLETVGYKVAHYIGFRLADDFLCYVQPGYISNKANTIAYAGALQQYLQVKLDVLE